MKTASSGFVEALNQPIRPTTQFQAVLGVSIGELAKDATVSYGNKVEFATGILDTKHECDYITFEKDFFRVGSDQRIVPDSGYLQNGFVSSAVANNAKTVDGKSVIEFQSPPVITIKPKEARSFDGLTFQFTDCYPYQILVYAYLESKLKAGFYVYPDAMEYQAMHQIPKCDEIKLTFLSLYSSAEKLRRLRLTGLSLGWAKTYTTADVISVEHTMSVDVLSFDLPSHHLTMKVANYDKAYNPDNPSGIWKYFSRGQPIRIRYGTEVNGATEWLDADRLYLSDAPKVEGDTATFEAYDRLYFLTETYTRGVYVPAGQTLRDMAIDVLQDAGVTDYDLGEWLSLWYISTPMPLLTHRECLQLIANASGHTLTVDRDGRICFAHPPVVYTAQDSPEDFYLDFSKAMDKPIVSRTEQLRRIEFTTHAWSLDSTAQNTEDIYKGDGMTVTEPTVIDITYDPVYNPVVRFHADNSDLANVGVTATTYELFARAAHLVVAPQGNAISGSFPALRANGERLREDTGKYTVECNASGEICAVDNPLIERGDYCGALSARVQGWYGHRSIYEVNFRQDFRLEPLDVITFRTQFEENVPVMITKLQFKLPGQTGAISVRRMN